MSHEKAGAKKEESKGSGFLSSLLVAGGAAALGFMAHKLVSEYNEIQEREDAYKAEGSGSGNTRKSMRSQAFDTEVPDAVKCVICMDNPREVIMGPCGHVCLCEDCMEKIAKSNPSPKCPVCQTPVKEFKHAYI
uniref:RING-type domain-containing protein n=1 Tax=Cuerna arida TaxID=1464854 RepID=A0A1B6G7Y8_9HEMI